MKGNHINDLVKLSHSIGNHISYAQGGGGNTSIKIDNNYMLIKASGYKLSDMNINHGYCTVNYKDIVNIINNEPQTNISESELYENIKKSSLDDQTPSIETGFHSLLPFKCIAHSHSVYTNILTCSMEGYEVSKKIFNDLDILWVDYKNPGKYLTYEIAKKYSNQKVVFLKNHGLIVCEDNIKSLISLHENINQKVRKYFSIKDYSNSSVSDSDIDKSHILFPDQVIFMSENISISSEAYRENLSAYIFILNTIKELNLTPVFIQENDVNYIQEMESEKFRKKISK